MIQDSLVEYISSQLKLGVSQNAIKASLVGAGWQAVDVDDTLRKVIPAAAPATVSAPATAGATQPAFAAKPASSPFTATGSGIASSPATGAMNMGGVAAAKPAVKPAEPQTIRVSDLVSTADSAVVSASPVSSAKASENKFFSGKSDSAVKASEPVKMDTQFSLEQPAPKSAKGLVWGIIAVILIVALGALSGYLYMQNKSLSQGSGTASVNAASQVAALTSQVAALNASNTALAAQVAQAAPASQELALELSFYAAAPSSVVTSTQLSVKGVLSGGGKLPYALMAADGAKIYVGNSKDAKVVAVLQPIVGSSTQLSGVYIPGSDLMTVTAVNGAAF